MFDIGWSELLVIAVVAIIFIGPRELIPMLRTFGRYAGKLKRMAADFQSQFNEALREVELDGISKEIQQVRTMSPLKDIQDEVEKEFKPVQAAVSDATKPVETTPGQAPKPPAAEAKPEQAKNEMEPGSAAKPERAPEPSKSTTKAVAGRGRNGA